MRKPSRIVLLAISVFVSLITSYAQTRPRQTTTKPVTTIPSISKPDLLVRRDGTQLEALIIEITDKEIVYKRANNPNGPNFRVQKADFSYLKYGGNGEIEQFSNVVETAPAQAQLPLTQMAQGRLPSSQSQGEYLARVKKVNGLEVYIMSEPLSDYEAVVDVNTGLKAESLLTAGLINKSISGRVEQFVNRVKKENANVDAVVYSSGRRIVGIKFASNALAKDKGIGRVSKMKGMPVFVMCEPVDGYEVLQSKGGGIKWKSYISAGVINNTIEEDVEIIVKKLMSVRGVEGSYFDGTKEGEAIRFKN
ncbi:MAG: hypothetical protein EAZ91_21085 [Cytophagales bacterium]|nr:MAG: hypothetical protein EAZ91_21085 [Cytophagales bacterium]